jgi:SAM-dependent methyltransferase
MSDVFGLAALEYYRSSNKNLSISTCSSLGDEDEIPVGYLFRNLSEMPELEQRALAETKGRILEVGCGVGSHLLALNNSEAYGIDTSIGSLEVARLRGALSVQQSSWQSYEPVVKFDSIIALMNGLGLAGSLEKLPHFLILLSTWLTDTGSIIADSSDISYLFEEEEDGGVWMPATAYYGDLTYEITFKGASDRFDWLFVSFEQLRVCCTTLGLRCEKIFEGENQHYLARISR